MANSQRRNEVRLSPLIQRRALLLLAVALALAAGASLLAGPVPLSLAELGAALLDGPPGPQASGSLAQTLLWQLRGPRALLALAAGAALALCGVSLQALFRNPLADPAVIGISIGAACGALAATLFASGVPLAQPLAALCGALVLSTLVVQLGRHQGAARVETMLLAGIGINALGGALIGLALALVARDDQIRQFVFWTLGSLTRASGSGALALMALLLLGAGLLWRQARAMDLLLLGDAEAYHGGVPVARLRRHLLVASALLAGLSVALCGTIGFVGLVAPHLARMLVGPGHQRLLPAACLLGATLLLLADTAARTTVAPAELPLGVLTALLGAPFFLVLLQRQAR